MILLHFIYWLIFIAVVLYVGISLILLWVKKNRKSLSNLKINWNKIPSEFNYLVLDGDGFIFAYATKPVFFGPYDMWASAGEKKEDWKLYIVKRISPELHCIDYKNEILTRPGYDPTLQVY